MTDRQGVRSRTFTGVLDEACRATLRDSLGAVFTDESVARAGSGWLSPDRRVTVTPGRGETEWRLLVWDVGDDGTSDDWVEAQVHAAFSATELVLQPEAGPT